MSHCVHSVYADYARAKGHIDRMKRSPLSQQKKSSGLVRQPYLCPSCRMWRISAPAQVGHSSTRVKEAAC